MDVSFGVVLTCAVFGAAIGLGWSGWLTQYRPGWQSQYANPRKWYSWVFGPLLCTALSIGHFVEGRPKLGCTFVIIAAAAFFFLLTSAVSRPSPALTSGPASFQANHRLIGSTPRGPIVEFSFCGQEDVSRGNKIRPYLEDKLDQYRPVAVLLDFTECRHFFDNDMGSIIPAFLDRDPQRGRLCALLFRTERAAQSVSDLLKVMALAPPFDVRAFDHRDSAIAFLSESISNREKSQMARRPATSRDFRLKEMPEDAPSVATDVYYSPEDFKKIRMGFVPRDLDDKWFAYYEDPWLCLHRRSGLAMYRVRFESTGDGHRAVEVVVNPHERKLTRRKAARALRDAVNLIDILFVWQKTGPGKLLDDKT